MNPPTSGHLPHLAIPQCAQKAIFWKNFWISKLIHCKDSFSFSIPATHNSWCVPSWSTARAPTPHPLNVWDSSLSWVWCLRCNIGRPMLTQLSGWYSFFYKHYIMHCLWCETYWLHVLISVLIEILCFAFLEHYHIKFLYSCVTAK